MTDGQRSAEERERARLEREARRAAREGKAPPEPPAPPVESEPQAAPSQSPVAATEVRPPEPPPPFERVANSGQDTAASRHSPRVARSAAERRAAAKDFLAGRGGARRKPPRGPKPPGARGRGPRRATLAAIAGGVLVLVIAWFLLSLFQPFKGDGSGEVTVTIPRGASVGEIADLLEQREVIASAFFFRARVSLAGKADQFKAGAIPMRRDMSYGAAIDTLADPPRPDVVTITIPEGLSRAEIADVVGDSLSGDYVAASRRSRVLSPATYGGAKARSLEGFLFPATYELKPGRPVKELVDRQLVAFKSQLAKVDMRFAKSKNLTVYDVLTIASMIEREAQVARERKLVASVIYNRLSQGIPLGIDATIRFATGNWSEPLTQSELATGSPYNTRTNQGLPPGPIGNPGLASIEAAAHPAKTDYLYYVVKPGACGEHSFSSTDAEFQQDVELYNSERARRGGKSPTDC
jgi:uncharacterized YceG family protein